MIALKAFELEGNNCKIASCVAALAHSSLLLGEPAVATEYIERARALYERLGMHCTSEMTTVLLTAGEILMFEGGRAELANEQLERCLAMRMDLLPPDHPSLGAVYYLLAQCNTMRGKCSAATAAEDAALSIGRRSQTHCAGPGCERRQRPDGAPLDVCVNCRRTFYCGKACQTADWKRKGGHKAECKALIAEAAGAGSK